MKKVLAVAVLCCCLSNVASADVVLYGPGDWFIYYVAGKAIGWAWDHFNDPYATRNAGPGYLETDGCTKATCPSAPFGGGGGGGF